jgi:hypothetical protein
MFGRNHVASAGSGSARIPGLGSDSARVRIRHARRLVTTVRKHPGVRAILTISLPAESRPDRQPKDLPNLCDCLVRYQNFPGTSRKTSSGLKELISLGLWAH